MQGKLEEEISLIAEHYFEIGTEEEPAFYFSMKDAKEKAIVQMKESQDGIVFTYSLIVRKLDGILTEQVFKILSENWDLVEVYLWTMEINEEWYLLASNKCVYETYLPGQIKNRLAIVRQEIEKEQ